MPIRFAVLGDLHFADPRFHTLRRTADLERYEAARRAYYATLAEEVRSARPEFVVQLGDLLEGQWDRPEQAEAELAEALAWLSSFGCPCNPIRGNHDDSGPAARACDAVLAPYLATLDLSQRQGFSYEFTAGGARFVFVDCRESIERPATRDWLRDLRHRVKEGERLFVFAHQPLFPVARVFFSDPPFVRTLRDALAPCAVDGYFCGHTHNQALAYHPAYGKGGILQVKTAVVGILGAEPLPLEQTRALLLPPAARYFAGYLEDTLPSWFLVEADAVSVRLTWHRIAHGIEGILRWNRPGDAEWQSPPPPRPLLPISDADLSHARSARIHMAFHHSEAPGKRVLLNGIPVGEAPRAGSFAPRSVVELRPEHLRLLRRENTVALENAPAEPLCWGGIYLEVETAAGRRVRSTCADKVYVVGPEDEAEEPLPMLERRRPGETLGPVTAAFVSDSARAGS
jgi:hypothetical protein